MNTRNATMELILSEPYKIGHALGFKDLTTLHNKWLREMLLREDDMTLIAHRGSYKTTTLSLFIALHTIIKPNETVMFFRKTDTDVSEVMTQVQKMLDSGCMQMITRELYNCDLDLIRINGGMIDTNLHQGVSGAPQVLAAGIGSSITGKHADIVITDDIVNARDRVSSADRRKTKLAYMELQNIKNRGGRFINTGTPWHKEDAISLLMPNIEKYDWKTTGLIGKEEIEKIRRSMTPSLFAANYELQHIADEEALFGTPMYFDDPEMLYDGVAHVDAAYGGSSGDGTAFTIAHKVGERFYMFGKRWNKHVDDCLSEMFYLMDKYRVGSLYMERNSDKGYLAEKVTNAGRPCVTYVESTNKYIKISTYLRSFWDHIQWFEDTDTEYMNEILDYNENAAHDDSPDSAASIIREMGNEVTYNPVEGGY